MKTQSGASRIVDALGHTNVRCVFGLPGTQNLELFESLRRSGLRTVVATNELSAAFMAGGWARATGQPGVLLTIGGPGFTWAFTGVAEARLDSIPLLYIAALQGVPNGRRFNQQQIDHSSIASTLVKRVVYADVAEDPAIAVLEALDVAASGEPGPVLLEISASTLMRDFAAVGLEPRILPKAHDAALKEVCDRVRRARRPILLVGQGANGYAPLVKTLVEKLKIPLLTSPSARGVIPEDHPLSFGLDPFAASVGQANSLIEAADLVLVVGCKLGHSATEGFKLCLPPEKLVHLDASAEVVGANYPASLGVVADAGALFEALIHSVRTPSEWTDDELHSWRARLTVRVRKENEPRVAGTAGGDAQSFFASLRQVLPADAILVVDSGTHQILARRYFRVLAPRSMMIPTNLQSMGFAIPTAIAACLASPNRKVVALLGDGGFAMTALELLTAVRENISLVVIVLVDGALGQIRAQQLVSYGHAHGVALRNPDFQPFVESLGATYSGIHGHNLDAVLRAALCHSGVTVIEVPVGDTFAIRRSALTARARESARLAMAPRLFRSVTSVLRKAQRLLKFTSVLLGVPGPINAAAEANSEAEFAVATADGACNRDIIFETRVHRRSSRTVEDAPASEEALTQ